MREETRQQIHQVWPTLDSEEARQVVEQFRRTIKEMIDEHFRIDPATSPQPQRDDLRQTIESQPGRHQQGKPTHAVRVA